MKRWLPIVVIVLSATLDGSRDAFAGLTRAERASSLFASANARVARGTHEQRQFALTELQEASKLDPSRSDIALALGRLCLEADLLSRARGVARHLTDRDSGDAGAWLLEGQVWRRYWLTTIDEVARDRAIACLARSARLAPKEPKAWLALAPLLADAGEVEASYAVAVLGARAAPAAAEAQVQLAAAAWRTGEVATAERLFGLGVPRLSAKLRERYHDIAPLLPPKAAEAFASLDAAGQHRFTERFWADTDPDPVSIENEARLEYWARVTQATSLYGTSRPGEWDMRAQYYVRFGRPEYEELNPIRKPQRVRTGDWLAWTYSELGLRVWMGTSSLIHGFSRTVTGSSTVARAFPDSLARHDGLVPLSGGWAVFHRLPPGVRPLDTRLAVARFQSGAGTSLFAQAEARGDPGDRYTAEWVVLDSANAPVTREQRSMSASACRADQARSASLTATLREGRYSVAVQVSDSSGRRGTVRSRIVASPGSDQLALSDLVVTCGSPAQSVVPGSGVRLEPETGLFPAVGDRLSAYFEIYNLEQSERGDARFAYECTVKSADRDRRGWLSRMIAPLAEPPPIEVSRAETTLGAMRRQFLSLPVGPLPPGRYEITVMVRDLANGASASAFAQFDRGR